jgi:excisionase family DNA binding protein
MDEATLNALVDRIAARVVELLRQSERQADVAERVVELLSNRPEKRYLDREQYAQELGVNVKTVDRLIRKGKLAHKRIGRRVKIEISA